VATAVGDDRAAETLLVLVKRWLTDELLVTED
jgi:hypothetical protein